jgi:prepilin-type N-terminal cleavage/methylation domain-containing protein
VEVSWAKVRRFWCQDRGFTLPEVLIVIVLMGIVLAIASSIWFNVVESRAVDSATNQVASDLRLAHTSATNQLADWQVSLTSGSSTYTMGRVGATPSTRTLPDGTEAGTTVTITFKPDGSAQATASSPYKVRAADGDPDHDIQLNEATSRVSVVS